MGPGSLLLSRRRPREAMRAAARPERQRGAPLHWALQNKVRGLVIGAAAPWRLLMLRGTPPILEGISPHRSFTPKYTRALRLASLTMSQVEVS